MHNATDLCVCGHTREQHQADADFNGLRYVGHWGKSEVLECACELFRSKEEQ